MPVVNYFSVEGQLLGEQAGSGAGSRADYLTDALGSVTAATDQSAQVKNTYRYKPYGQQLAKTGGSADPAFKWVGTLGYRNTARKYSNTYIRARHYDSSIGRWTTVDLFFSPNAEYTYAWNQVCTYIDPEGTYPQLQNQGKPKNQPLDNKKRPPDCSKISGNCKAVWMTCDTTSPGKHAAVYCNPKSSSPKKGKCMSDYCYENGHELGNPVFPIGSTVCIHGTHGNTNRKIDDCGCGLYRKDKPVPDNWMDFQTNDCSGFTDGWRCICAGPCARTAK